jgi:hypothetical protein
MATAVARRLTHCGMCCTGVFLLVFAAVALSGPGRIDIVDGQARFETAKSLALHGDPIVRNAALWFSVFPGRNGAPYSYYRFPHSALGALAVIASDATGPDRDARRHYFFSLMGAVAAAFLASIYFVWFSSRGLAWRSAALWALAGIFCTPGWYYGTSTFDEIFGALGVTAGIVLAVASRSSPACSSAFWSGLGFGLAFNVKEPLGIFALAGLCAADRPSDARSQRLCRASMLTGGLLAGLVLYVIYDLYKFPPGTKEHHAELLAKYLRPYPGHFFWGLAGLTISPAAGFLWYCPSLVVPLLALRHWIIIERRFTIALLASTAVFVGFVASISFFKGDPAWGPRYLTPVFAVLWLLAPDGARRLRPQTMGLVLLAGAVVQLLALSADPDRLYVERGVPPAFGALAPVLHFDPRLSHIINRPREIIDIWKARHDAGVEFAPWDVPTASPRVISWDMLGPKGVLRYKVLNSFRPWWVSHRYMAAGERPVSIMSAVAVLGVTLSAGMALMWLGIRMSRKAQPARMSASTEGDRNPTR